MQEQMDNGDLTARLDDARNLLRDRGLEADVRVGSHRGGEAQGRSTSDGEGAEDASFPDESPSRRRKTPFAQISGGDSLASDRRQGPGCGYRVERARPGEDETLEATARGRARSPLVPQGPAELDAGCGQFGRFDHSDPLRRRHAGLAGGRIGKADGDRRSEALGRFESDSCHGAGRRARDRWRARVRCPRFRCVRREPGGRRARRPSRATNREFRGRSRRRKAARSRLRPRRQLRTRPPAGVYFRAFETRLPKICWQREASVRTE